MADPRDTHVAPTDTASGGVSPPADEDTSRVPLLSVILVGQISLVLTSPPYGKTMHGRVEHRHGPLSRFHNAYSAHHDPANPDEGNLAHRGRAGLLDGITAVLAGCLPLLNPDGVIAVVARP